MMLNVWLAELASLLILAKQWDLTGSLACTQCHSDVANVNWSEPVLPCFECGLGSGNDAEN